MHKDQQSHAIISAAMVATSLHSKRLVRPASENLRKSAKSADNVEEIVYENIDKGTNGN